MKPKIAKSQLEVWEWKERAYNAIKDIPVGQQAHAIHERTRKTREWLEKAKSEQKKAA